MTIENPSIRLTIDQRRVDLLNDPNYGIVLCFLEKYRSQLNLPCYPFQLLEDHLLRYQGQIPSRLIDLHFILLKRISPIKNVQHEKFDSIITKFAERFDVNDSEHLSTTGYLQSDIPIKIRLLKNLLESQFDFNQTFRNTFADQSCQDCQSRPIGRDRFGANYWFFMEENGFVRLFREDVDVDRTWTNVVKDREEFEQFIGLLITDFIVRKKFFDWIIAYETFASLLPSDAFEQRYLPIEQIEFSEKRKQSKYSPERQDVQNCESVVDDEEMVDDLSLAVRRSNRLGATSDITSEVSQTRKRQRTSTTSSSEETSLCYVCARSDRPEVLLLCDGCDDAYHLECLRPILLSVPDGDWFCPLCEHRQLAECLMGKFQEFTINYQRMEIRRASKRSIRRKIRPKDYSSDESVTASESESETILAFDLKIPEKITRLLHRRHRNVEQPIKRLSTHSNHPSNDSCELNEKLGSPLVYVTSKNQSHPIKSVVTNSKQTMQITRRWNDLQRRSRMKAINTQVLNPTQCTDENSNMDLDHTPSIHTHHQIQDKTIHLHESTPLISVDIYATRNILHRAEATFDRLTRDIQFAVNEAHSIPIEAKVSDQIQIKRMQKKLSSPFMSKTLHIPKII